MLLALLLNINPTLDLPECEALLGGDASLRDASAQCQKSQLPDGAEQTTCHWSYNAHEGHAQRRFRQLTTLIEYCVEGVLALPPEPGVNHPDSYEQRLFVGQGWRISLSLKKKGALAQAFVFLGISPRP